MERVEKFDESMSKDLGHVTELLYYTPVLWGANDCPNGVHPFFLDKVKAFEAAARENYNNVAAFDLLVPYPHAAAYGACIMGELDGKQALYIDIAYTSIKAKTTNPRTREKGITMIPMPPQCHVHLDIDAHARPQALKFTEAIWDQFTQIEYDFSGGYATSCIMHCFNEGPVSEPFVPAVVGHEVLCDLKLYVEDKGDPYIRT